MNNLDTQVDNLHPSPAVAAAGDMQQRITEIKQLYCKVYGIVQEIAVRWREKYTARPMLTDDTGVECLMHDSLRPSNSET